MYFRLRLFNASRSRSLAKSFYDVFKSITIVAEIKRRRSEDRRRQVLPIQPEYNTTVRQLPRLSCIPGATYYRRLRVAALRTQPDLNTDDPWKTKNDPDFPLETE